MDDMEMDPSRVSNSLEEENGRSPPPPSRLTYRDMAQQNNLNLNFAATTNPNVGKHAGG